MPNKILSISQVLHVTESFLKLKFVSFVNYQIVGRKIISPRYIGLVGKGILSSCETSFLTIEMSRVYG